MGYKGEAISGGREELKKSAANAVDSNRSGRAKGMGVFHRYV